jgi:type VII secretion protein EccB
MATRRDQLQSHQFMMQRVTSALVIHDTDPQQSPFRRFAGSAFAGLMIAIIVIAGVAIYGLLVNGGKKSWRSDSAIVLEKETGVRYVYREATNTLHPVANYASARLLGASVTVSASRNSLAGTPRGRTLGIAGAPDFVPRAKDLLTSAWTLCASPFSDGSGQANARTVLLAGRSPAGGRPLDAGALLVRAVDDPKGTINLVWNGRRFEIRQPEVVLKALAWESVQPTKVRVAWLNGLSSGQPIQRVPVPSGTSSFRNTATGRTYFVRNTAGDTQYYVAVPDGLAKVTAMQADVIRGDSQVNPSGQPPEEIQAGQVVESRSVSFPIGAAPPPAVTPKLAPIAERDTVCAVYPTGVAQPRVLIGAAFDSGSSFNDTGGIGANGTPLADRVLVEPGRAMLVMALPSPEASTSTMLLVTEPGRAYPVTPDVAAQYLALPVTAAVRLPAALINRMPLGPALDPARAGLPVDGA